MQHKPPMTQVETPVSGNLLPPAGNLQHKASDSARRPRNVRPAPQDAPDVRKKSGLHCTMCKTYNTSHP
eukprot:102071-Karenia_brevis.AAC.1